MKSSLPNFISRFQFLLALAALSLVGSLSGEVRAQSTDPAKVVIVLDASGSMWGKVDGVPKIEVARETIADILETWNPSRAIGLMAYGHREKGSCEDIEMLIPAAPLDRAAFLSVVNSIIPKGKTPLTDAVVLAAGELRYTEDPATVILVSDGKETCNKDPRTAAKELAKNGIGFKAHVIGFDITAEEGESLSAIAEETGGVYVAADDAAGLKSALEQVVSVVEEEKAVPVEPAPEPMPEASTGFVEYTAVATTGGEEVSTYFTTYTEGLDYEGKREQVASGTRRKLELKPGSYMVNAKWGTILRQIEYEITAGETLPLTIDMNGGILELTALAVEGGEEVKPYYTIYEAKADLSGKRKQVTSGTNRKPILGAGEYTVSAGWGKAVATETVTITPGALTEATLILNGGILALSSSQIEGGEDLKAYYTIYEAAKNLSGDRKQITSGTGREPILPAGTYFISGNWGRAYGQTGAVVTAGERSEAHVLIESGTIHLKPVDPEGNPIKSYNTIYRSEKSLEGKQEQVTSGSGTTLQLPSGTFDIRGSAKGYVGETTGITLEPGEVKDVTLTLNPVKE